MKITLDKTPPLSTFEVSMLEVGGEHWYTSPKLKGRYVPSVSTVLGTLKDGLEFVSAWDLKKAQERGIRLHKATEHLEMAGTLERNFQGHEFDDKEWLMLLGFARWYSEFKPKALYVEIPLANKRLGYGGTLDRIYDIGGVITLVDIKTTSVIYDKHWMQVAAYRELALKAKLVPEIHETAILRLADKTKKGYQWETRCAYKSIPENHLEQEPPWVEDDYNGFLHLLKAYEYLHPGEQPTILDLPEFITLGYDLQRQQSS